MFTTYIFLFFWAAVSELRPWLVAIALHYTLQNQAMETMNICAVHYFQHVVWPTKASQLLRSQQERYRAQSDDSVRCTANPTKSHLKMHKRSFLQSCTCGLMFIYLMYIYSLMCKYIKMIAHLERTHNIIFYNIPEEMRTWFHHHILKDKMSKQLLKVLHQISSYKETDSCLQKSLVALMTLLRTWIKLHECIKII